MLKVAPARERGLKLYIKPIFISVSCRSREGAWIEILGANPTVVESEVAPARERGLKLKQMHLIHYGYSVAPARERGLKLP